MVCGGPTCRAFLWEAGEEGEQHWSTEEELVL